MTWSQHHITTGNVKGSPGTWGTEGHLARLEDRSHEVAVTVRPVGTRDTRTPAIPLPWVINRTFAKEPIKTQRDGWIQKHPMTWVSRRGWAEMCLHKDTTLAHIVVEGVVTTAAAFGTVVTAQLPTGQWMAGPPTGGGAWVVHHSTQAHHTCAGRAHSKSNCSQSISCFWDDTTSELTSGFLLICYNIRKKNSLSPHVIQITFVKGCLNFVKSKEMFTK